MTMPNWIDDEGYNWFGKLQCKRCSGRFDAVKGEIPVHDCIGGRYKSASYGSEYHVPVWVSDFEYSKKLSS